MLHHLRPAVSMTVVLTLLTGLAYPLAMSGLAHVVVPDQAAGSLISRDGKVIGSALLAQGFAGPGYLHPRPSASGYRADGSSGSNLSPLNPALQAEAESRRQAWQAENGGAEVPADALTASASGLDPDVSPANARGQAARIALARGMDPAEVQKIIDAQLERRWLGLYGAPRINVLAVNLALDAIKPLAPAAAN